MKKKIFTILAVLCLIAGVSVISYPTAMQWLYSKDVEAKSEAYTETYRDADLDWLYQLFVAYNEDLFMYKQQNLVEPFSYEQSSFNLREFGLDEDIIGYLDIPQLSVELPIYLGASKENMTKGAVHLTETSLPIGGLNTNAVIAAHRGYSKAQMFRHLDKLQLGDVVSINNFWETLYYQVTSIEIIEPNEIDKVLIQPGRDMVTLITCHPYRVNSHRYVVFLDRYQPS